MLFPVVVQSSAEQQRPRSVPSRGSSGLIVGVPYAVDGETFDRGGRRSASRRRDGSPATTALCVRTLEPVRMSSVDAVTEKVDERTDGLAGSPVESLARTVARHARSGNLAAASGAVSLVRAGRTFLKGNRKRALLQAAVGLFWVGVALAQRRAGGRSESEASSTTEISEVADTSPDVEDAVDPGDRDTDHATGEEVVDTTDADVPSDDSSEVGVSSDVAEEVAGGQADQRDVVGTDEIESAASDGGDEGASGSDEESDSDETVEAESGSDDERSDDAGADEERAETESAE